MRRSSILVALAIALTPYSARRLGAQSPGLAPAVWASAGIGTSGSIVVDATAWASVGSLAVGAAGARQLTILPRKGDYNRQMLAPLLGWRIRTPEAQTVFSVGPASMDMARIGVDGRLPRQWGGAVVIDGSAGISPGFGAGAMLFAAASRDTRLWGLTISIAIGVLPHAKDRARQFGG